MSDTTQLAAPPPPMVAVQTEEPPPRYLVLDLETTGFGPAHIVEIGLVEFINGRPTGNKWCTLVNPGVPIPADATKVHGITDEMVAGAPPWSAVGPQVVQWLSQDVPIIGHNIRDFDGPMLVGNLKRLGLEMPKCKFVDTMLMARQAFPGQPNHLSAVAARLGIKPSGLHRAEADCVTTGQVLVALLALNVTETALAIRPGESSVVVMAKRTVLGYLQKIGDARAFVQTLKCTTEAELEICVRATGRLKQIGKDADQRRKDQVQETTKITGEINGVYRELVAKPLSDLEAEINRIMAPYQTEKALKLEAERERLRLEAEAKAAAERAEAARLNAIAEAQAAEQRKLAAEQAAAVAAEQDAVKRAALEAQAKLDAEAAEQRLAESLKAAEQAAETADHIAATASRTESELAASGGVNAKEASATIEWVYEFKVVDPLQVPQSYWKIDEDAIAAAFKAGIKAIPGVELVSKTANTKTRAKKQ